jgi:NAD(P)H-hydrate epimerase
MEFINNTIIFSGQIIIDAILGIGLDRKLEDEFLLAIRQINSFPDAFVYAVDMPTGLFSDLEMPADAEAVKASTIFKFHAPVINLFLPQYLKFYEELYIVDIGLTEPPDFSESFSSAYFVTGEDYFNKTVSRRPKNSHKGSFGHSCLVAGSFEKGGAALIAAKACIRSGTGLLTLYIPKSLIVSAHTVVPEAMLQLSSHENRIEGRVNTDAFTAIGFGPGTGTSAETAATLKQIIQDSNLPLVIDADGLNILAENPTWLAFLKPDTILTPHPGEFARLSNENRIGINQIIKASELAVRFNIVILLKGACTAVCLPDASVHFNSSGNAGMARGGSGDVLTGIITSLLAQGYHPWHAARLGSFIHGKAGDYAAGIYSEHAMRVTDLSECIPDVFNLNSFKSGKTTNV